MNPPDHICAVGMTTARIEVHQNLKRV